MRGEAGEARKPDGEGREPFMHSDGVDVRTLRHFLMLRFKELALHPLPWVKILSYKSRILKTYFSFYSE